MVFSAATSQEIDKLYKKRQHVELTIGLLKDGNKEISHFGPDRKEDGDIDKIYAVGSICKTFTASLLAKYLSEGKLELSAGIDKYIPGLPERYYPTLERLASHSSGFKTQPYTFWTTLPVLLNMNREGGLFHTNPFRGYPKVDDMMKIIRDTVLEDKTYDFVYSNIGIGILGYIVGQINGEGYWDSMNRYIKEDLGLKNTFLGNVSMPGYDKKDQPCRCWQWEKEDVIAPAGGLCATVDDLLTYAQINLDGSKPYLSACHEVHGPCEKNADSGLSWRLEKDMPVSWHTGSAGAFNSFIGINRETKRAVVVSVNYGLVNAEQIGFSILKNDL
ncbi:serine hydrolase domain-containing protein [Butyrivibrio sp. MC2013]|uniref:serine hydrolase domain-containing protein n=1 Tax=Butyrivibrio sp. MC2013 TaxID=1280686 RepID=UPI00041FE412|nr:serine hydrolase domain-containing protein [Butyrivibrio sp. MC2013]